MVPGEHAGVPPGPEDILSTYDRVAERFEQERDASLVEQELLDRFLASAGSPVKRLLDVGCGPGKPIATYLRTLGIQVTGVDGSPAMVARFRANLPGADVHLADMRALHLGECFDAVLAFDSFFHLSPKDQRGTIEHLAEHVRPGGILMLNTGDEAGVRFGQAGGASVFHSSLDPKEYRRRFVASGLEILEYLEREPRTGRTVWMLRRAEAGPKHTLHLEDGGGATS